MEYGNFLIFKMVGVNWPDLGGDRLSGARNDGR